MQLGRGSWQGEGRRTRNSWMEREWREFTQIGWRRRRRCRSIAGAGAMGLESRHTRSEQRVSAADSRCRRPAALSFSLSHSELQNCPCGTRLVEKSTPYHLGYNSGHHTHGVLGTPDASNQYPPGSQGGA